MRSICATASPWPGATRVMSRGRMPSSSEPPDSTHCGGASIETGLRAVAYAGLAVYVVLVLVKPRFLTGRPRPRR